MHTINSKFNYMNILMVVSVGLFVSACSSSGDGGSVSGSGSSSVEGNVNSISIAMLNPPESREYSTSSREYSLAVLLKSLLPVQSAFAGGALEGIRVTIGQLGTTTNSSGYFRIDGVPPGTHDVVFSRNNQTTRTSVRIGENELVSMQNISMRGSQIHVGNVEHHSRGGTPGTPHR